MNKKRVAFVSAILVVVVLLVATAFIYGKTFRKTPPKEPGEYTRGSLLMKEADLPELVKNSEVILRGKVIKVLPSVEGPKPKIVVGEKAAEEAANRGELPVRPAPDEKAAQEMAAKTKGIIYTDKIIKVDKYYKNPLQTDTIIVRELGGELGEREEPFPDQTPLKVDDDVLLFLSKGWLSKEGDNTYWITAAFQGKYYIKGAQAIREDSQVSKGLTEFEAEIKTLLGQ